jgi:mannose-6-phosphate isomerase-like protein (cupin superfamily)
VLVGGHSPHAPHAHGDEELLIPLHGDVDLMIATSPTDTAPRVERVRPGSFVYYPAGQHHTIRNPGVAPVSYLMFKWQAADAGTTDPLGIRIVHYGDVAVPPDAPGFWTRHLFEGATRYLGKLHAHETVLAPGGGYDPHVDAYDVAIVTLSGRVETLGQVVEPESVIYYAAGELHGMRNSSAEPARYLVFEFHAPGVGAPRWHGGFRARLVGAAKRVARPVWHWLEPYLSRPGRTPSP